MPLDKQGITACLACTKRASGDPPCLGNNKFALENHHPSLRFENQIYVEWPCYFHADWYELAPLLLGQNPGDGKYNASDFQLSAYPGGLNRQYLQGLKDGVAEWARTNCTESTSSPTTLKRVREEACQNSPQVNYTTARLEPRLNGDTAVLLASHRDGRYKSWLDSLQTYANQKMSSSCSPVESKWKFKTYGGAGGGLKKSGTGGQMLGLESDAKQKLALIHIAVQQAVDVEKLLRAPARVADFRHDVDDQEMKIDAAAEDEAARGAVVLLAGIRNAGSRRDAVDHHGDFLFHAGQRIERHAGIHKGMRHFDHGEAVLSQNRELEIAGGGAGSDAAADDAGILLKVDVPVERVHFHTQAERQTQLTGYSANEAVGGGEVTGILVFGGSKEIGERDAGFHAETEGLAEGGGSAGQENK